MQEYVFEKVNEKLYKETIKGIDVYMYPFNKTKNFYITITVKFGARCTKYIKNNKEYDIYPGSAHFLEHRIMLVGEDEELSNRVNNLGSIANAWTSNYATNYNIFGSENINENIKLLLDIFYKPKFLEKDVNDEKSIINEEIDMNKDNLDRFLHDEVFHNLFNNSYAKNTVIGEKEDICKIDYKYLDNLYKDFYIPCNTFIVVSGNFDKDEVINTIKCYLEDNSFNKDNDIKVINDKEDDNVRINYEEINRDVVHDNIRYAFKINKSVFKGYSNNEIETYLNIIFKINFSFLSNKYEKYKENNIIYNMSIYNCIIDDYVVIVINAITDKYNEFISTIDSDLLKMNINKDDFNRFKKKLIKQDILQFENIEDVEYKIVDELTKEGKIDFNDYSFINNLDYDKCIRMIKLLNFDNKIVVRMTK